MIPEFQRRRKMNAGVRTSHKKIAERSRIHILVSTSTGGAENRTTKMLMILLLHRRSRPAEKIRRVIGRRRGSGEKIRNDVRFQLLHLQMLLQFQRFDIISDAQLLMILNRTKIRRLFIQT